MDFLLRQEICNDVEKIGKENTNDGIHDFVFVCEQCVVEWK